jgi:uncharacterized protein YacL
MVLHILRGVFLLLVASVTMLYVLPFQADRGVQFGEVLLMVGLTLGIAGAIVAGDVLIRRKRLSALSGVFLGLIAGLLAAYALSFVVDLIGLLVAPDDPAAREAMTKLLQGVKVLIGLITCYLGISLVIQTKDDFRFVIPYVEFTKQIRGPRPTLLDSSTIIDGRVLDLAGTHALQGPMLVPKFVLDELQLIADSADRVRRTRGRRGLDLLHRMQSDPKLEVSIVDMPAEGATVDQRLVALAQEIRARLMTNDYNLTKIARLRGVEVVNINELALAVRPVVLPGETIGVKVIRPGEAAGQGVGYLEDGTMVVVENARHMIGREVQLVVTSSLQTSAGRMIFGRYEEPAGGEPGSAAGRAAPPGVPVSEPKRP